MIIFIVAIVAIESFVQVFLFKQTTDRLMVN